MSSIFYKAFDVVKGCVGWSHMTLSLNWGGMDLMNGLLNG